MHNRIAVKYMNSYTVTVDVDLGLSTMQNYAMFLTFQRTQLENMVSDTGWCNPKGLYVYFYKCISLYIMCSQNIQIIIGKTNI